jgi:SAM-dependent methyltransferase
VLRRVKKAMTARAVTRMSPDPVSELFGLDRGNSVDRHYIDGFFAANATRIRGRVLDIADDSYARRFGHGIEQVDVLYLTDGNPKATIVGDLQDPGTLPAGSFDCILLPQTLQFIADPRKALANCREALRPGGALLASIPGISQISRYDEDRWGDRWRFTERGARELFERAFEDGDDVAAEAHGNAAAACAFLQGVSLEEMPRATLDARHRDYPLVVTVAATRR